MKRAWIGLAALALVLLGLFLLSTHKSIEKSAEVTGSVTYRERVALPAGSVVKVDLQDTSLADAPATTLGSFEVTTKGENVPIPFAIIYNPAQIDEKHTYILRATITTDGALKWTNTSSVPVLTNGHASTSIEVLVSMVVATNTSTTSATTTKTVSAPNPLLGTTWVWQNTTFLDGSKKTPTNPNAFVITFGADKRFNSTTDCNTLMGPFISDNEILSIGPIASTKMACASGSLESEYSQELSRATSQVMSGSELRINLVKDSGTMVFTRKPAAVNLNGSTFRLTSFNGSAIPQGTNYTLAFSNGSIAAKFCNGLGGSYSLKNGIITAPTLVGTLMYCETPANLMTMENVFGAMLRTGAHFDLQGSTLTLSDGGGEKMVYTIFMD